MPSTYDELKRRALAEAQVAGLGGRPVITVGMGICGVSAGAREVYAALQDELKKQGVDAVLHPVGCVGFCYAETLVDIARPGQPRISYKNITPERVPELVRDAVTGANLRSDLALGAWGASPSPAIPNIHEFPEWKHQVRIATRNCGVVDPENTLDYIARGGYAALNKALFDMKPDQVIDEVIKSNLRGRGGAAFPTGQKWKFLAGSPGPVKYILCNGEEGDAGAFNDKALLESDPNTVLEGIILAGYATRATKGYIFIRCEHWLPIQRARRAIKQAYDLGILGKNIMGSEFSFDAAVAQTGESYVSGEETALMEAIEGRRAMPRPRPPFPAAVGLWGKPSNINNVKTYSYVPEIVARGGAWYASVGSERSKGTGLVCLSGDIRKPGLYELPFGLPLTAVIRDVGGGCPDGKKVKFLQTGGPLGGFLPASLMEKTPMDFDAMNATGAMFGSGGIIVGSEDACVVDVTRVLTEFNADESCGKCFPCRLGTHHINQIMSRIAEGKGRPQDMQTALGLAPSLAASLCAHGQLATNPIRTAYQYFKDEIEAHIKERRCPAGRCAAMRSHGSGALAGAGNKR
ncbi:MAG: NADH-ubiquinone oxidoreductase-F iron-sulfur binding region domain-containing protein [Dehalococcoidia bacterium]|nr:NADH-ubiquinone oxidoreductase-F iron-sulfur binding region domain-containing protein [Dehalococcoidia bacterium]